MENKTTMIQALDIFEEARFVNNLIQGLCARIDTHEFSAVEARGLMVLLAWQNEKIAGAEGVIKTVINKKAALSQAA